MISCSSCRNGDGCDVVYADCEMEIRMKKQIRLTAFTDPMIGLSYESEPIMERLEKRYANIIEFRYVMSLLVRDVSDFMLPDELAMEPESGIRRYCRRLAGIYKSEEHIGGYGIVWNDDIDIACDELFYNGTTIQTPFDGLIALSDATVLWGLSESTIRKAIAYGKLINGIDVCKFGKQWVISSDSMIREYGSPKQRTQ